MTIVLNALEYGVGLCGLFSLWNGSADWAAAWFACACWFHLTRWEWSQPEPGESDEND